MVNLNLILKLRLTISIILFASQCTPLVNNSILPDKITYNPAARLTSIKFDNNDILTIIRSLNVNKAHRHDGIPVRIKICDESCHLFSGFVLILVFIHILGNLT